MTKHLKPMCMRKTFHMERVFVVCKRQNAEVCYVRLSLMEALLAIVNLYIFIML